MFEEMIGQMNRFDMRKAIDHWKAHGLDFIRILTKPEAPEGISIFNDEAQDYSLYKAIDNRLIELAQSFNCQV